MVGCSSKHFDPTGLSTEKTSVFHRCIEWHCPGWPSHVAERRHLWNPRSCDCLSGGMIIYYHVCLINTSMIPEREWPPWTRVRGVFSLLLIFFMNLVHLGNRYSEHCSRLVWCVPVGKRVPTIGQALFSREQQGKEMK